MSVIITTSTGADPGGLGGQIPPFGELHKLINREKHMHTRECYAF